MTPCELCKGACCESIIAPVGGGPNSVWFRYHGEPVGVDRVELNCSCRMLKDGRCSVYDQRPDTCKAFIVGGPACRETVKRRRTNWREIFALFP